MGQKKVVLKGLVLDPVSQMPIVLLEDDSSGKMLPIWIGVFEANAIAIELEKVKTPRPMTHDLLLNFAESLNATVKKVVINDMSDSTYYAEIYVYTNDRFTVVDARPSDAIALALRADADIYVNETVFEKAVDFGAGDSLKANERIKKWLDDLPPEKLGKYEM